MVKARKRFFLKALLCLALMANFMVFIILFLVFYFIILNTKIISVYLLGYVKPWYYMYDEGLILKKMLPNNTQVSLSSSMLRLSQLIVSIPL